MTNPLQSSVRLSSLLDGLVTAPIQHDPLITGVALDSRKVVAGNLFIALSGARAHGKDYMNHALQAGAAAILLETDSDQVEGFPGAVPIISVQGLRQQVGEIAARYFGQPSTRLKLIGITGTNGKTSVCHILASCLQTLQKSAPCGVIGTLGSGLFGQLSEAVNTTPDALAVNQLLVEMLEQGARHAIMEVSSHGLQQGRVRALQFDSAIFTNLTRDHLDYHGTMQAYGEAKKALFHMPGLRHAVINLDDPFGRELLENLSADVRVFGYSTEANSRFSSPRCHRVIHAQSISCSRQGLSIQIRSGAEQASLSSPLMGAFNASNILAVVAALLSQGFELQSITAALQSVPVVPGRLEVVPADPQQPLVIVDYAHTPDGLRQALTTLRTLCVGELICVFGCGGDRDRGKRPLMGKIAAELADRLILTNDNPRSENPLLILQDIRSGIPDTIQTQQILDRGAAIAAAISTAKQQDIVLIAGKGHEDYQILGERICAFSDREQALKILSGGRT